MITNSFFISISNSRSTNFFRTIFFPNLPNVQLPWSKNKFHTNFLLSYEAINLIVIRNPVHP